MKIDHGGETNKTVLNHIDTKLRKNQEIEIRYIPGELDPFYTGRYLDAIRNDKRKGCV